MKIPESGVERADLPPVPSIVSECLPHSDMKHPEFTALAREFVRAHTAAPLGASVEIGTRRGGSALLMLMLLVKQKQYDQLLGPLPMVFSVDPYGGKPYNGGNGIFPGLYGDVEYRAMRALLAPFTNHAHFLMTSSDFLRMAAGVGSGTWRYWHEGNEQRLVNNTSFVLHDGQHDAPSIASDLRDLLAWKFLPAGGRIVIDNVDVDPATKGAVAGIAGDYGAEVSFPTPLMGVVVVRR